MAKPRNLLSAVKVAGATEPGYLADGGGLYLQVSRTGSKSWLFVYRRQGRRIEMGLGPLSDVTLQKARAKAARAREMLTEGKDPLSERRAERAVERGMTFKEVAEMFIAAHQPGWRNPKHGDQWRNTLASYAFPIFGDVPVQAVDTGAVMRVLQPIWAEKTETASRLRGRIENVLDYATARDWRAGDNPARWKGHLQRLLPARAKVQKVEHHPALPWQEIGAFMAELRKQEGVAARALAFTILTACRTGEVIGARRGEFAGDVWTIPGERMKSGREHRVPLSKEAQAILAAIRPVDAAEDNFVFPGAKPARPLSNMAMSAVLERMGRTDITVHGMRSTFRDWCAEATNFPRELAEMALGHVLKDKVEAAYARGDLLEKRRRLMQAWARYCGNPLKTGEVRPIRVA